ncbi:hypothetical protein [Thalassobaculum sp.]|uniref:hypothetical protein n=1 Tax=Thalassobaculum sp. TaxID=2022740 RepID=UPI0032EAF697
MRITAPVAATLLALLLAFTASPLAAAGEPSARCGPLPKPSDGKAAFDAALIDFLGDFRTGSPEPCFKLLGWKADGVRRPSGPVFVDPRSGALQSAGTHGAGHMRVWYSPEVIGWLEGGREGRVPDGGVIVKAMFKRQPPGFEDMAFSGYAIMVMDHAGSWDGWYYADGAPSGVPTEASATAPYGFYDYNSFGQYCVNCHASAVDNNTFATLRNLRVPDELPNTNEAPLWFATIIPTMPVQTLDTLARYATPHEHGAAAGGPALRAPDAAPAFDPDVFDHYPAVPPGYVAAKPKPFPYESYDHVPQGPQPAGHRPFLTSDQCIGCHNATVNNDSLPNMTLQVRAAGAPANSLPQRINLSPYAEWRYSMMGLSGRDPIFYAQLETERNLHPELADVIDNKCLSCHGVMGQRTYVHDNGPEALFTHQMVMADPTTADPEARRYGALARDGVSCMVCHRIEADGLGTPATYTGQFKVSADATKIYGPYKEVVEKPMQHAIGLTPEFQPQIRSSELCGSCHTVFTPSLDVDRPYTRAEFDEMAKTGKGVFHEQTTYLEWKNSAFSGQLAGSAGAVRSCQDCHMPNTFGAKSLAFRIASIEDENFPFVDERLPPKDLHMRVRGRDPASGDRYSRHSLHGINAFAGAFFEQFPWFLGVGRGDPMTGLASGPVNARSVAEMAASQTADVTIPSFEVRGGTVFAEVAVRNLTGHKFPSGVGFRRAFLEFTVMADGVPVWTSGDTDRNGVIGTRAAGAFVPLPSEFWTDNAYQPHYATVTDPNQVQIYEEVATDSRGDITSSFLALRKVLKDNRLQPRGWSADGPDAAITAPRGGAADDPAYVDGSGGDTVRYVAELPAGTTGRITARAILYYQAIPPHYLNQRMRWLGQEASDRLAWFVQNVSLGGRTADWKLRVASAHAAE